MDDFQRNMMSEEIKAVILMDADGNEIKPPREAKPGYYWVPFVLNDGSIEWNEFLSPDEKNTWPSGLKKPKFAKEKHDFTNDTWFINLSDEDNEKQEK
jgi:hypothetical protein